VLLRGDVAQVQVTDRAVNLALHVMPEYVLLVELFRVPAFVVHQLLLDVFGVLHYQVLVFLDSYSTVLGYIDLVGYDIFSKILKEMFVEFICVVRFLVSVINLLEFIAHYSYR